MIQRKVESNLHPSFQNNGGVGLTTSKGAQDRKHQGGQDSIFRPMLRAKGRG